MAYQTSTDKFKDTRNQSSGFKPNESQMSQVSKPHDSDNVHKINQLKELRLSLRKILPSTEAHNTEKQKKESASIDKQRSSSYITYFQQ